MNKYTVTHFVDVEPSRHGSIEIPFITIFEDSYYLGFEQNSPIPKDLMNKQVKEKFYVPLDTPQTVSAEQSLWINKEGEVFIANSKNPLIGEQVFLRKN
jgi:hypothetical protein